MTFPVKDGMQSYKPNFELPTDGNVLLSPADAKAIEGMLAVSLAALHRLLGCQKD